MDIEHHPSCKPMDMQYVRKCNQCGLEVGAEADFENFKIEIAKRDRALKLVYSYLNKHGTQEAAEECYFEIQSILEGREAGK